MSLSVNYFMRNRFLFLILPLLLFCGRVSHGQALSGIYTIGGVTPDYVTVGDAVTDLNTNGVNGPVRFEIRTGSYDEQVTINQFTGSSSINTVVFTSETGDRNDVIVHHGNTNSAVAFIIKIDGADHLTFEHLTLEADRSCNCPNDQPRVLYVDGDSDSLLFQNIHFKSWTSGSFFNYTDCISIGVDNASGIVNDYFTFKNNLVEGGATGIELEGSKNGSVFFGGHWIIEDNLFIHQKTKGITVQAGTFTSIVRNTVYADASIKWITGIEVVQHSDSLLIGKNEIILHGGGTGIRLAFIEAGTSAYSVVSNNLIVVGENGVSAPDGIHCQGNDDLLIAHNSILLNSTVSNGRCIRFSSSDSTTLRNNQIINSGGGYCYYQGGSAPSLDTDFNNLHNGGADLAFLDATIYTDIPSLVSGLGIDNNSISVDPVFLSDTVLIPYNSAAFNNGTLISTVADDYFGTMRSLTTPDMGYFEGDVPAVDVAVVGTSYSTDNVCVGDSLPVYVSFVNMGSQSLASVTIGYSDTSGVQGVFAWTGSMAQFDQQDSVLVGYVLFTGLQPIEIWIWSSNPNSTLDEQVLNDTLIVSNGPRLNGTYTIGDTLRDFLSFSEAVQALITTGVCGPVIFNVDSGTYNEQVVIPVIAGADSVNTITFQSAVLDSSYVTMTYLSSSQKNYLFKLDGAENIIIQHLGLLPQGSYKRAIHFTGGASNNVVRRNWMSSSSSGGSGTNAVLVFYEGTLSALKHNYLIENKLEGAGRHVYMKGNSTNVSYHNPIVGNTFLGPTGQSMYIERMGSVRISQNKFIGNAGGNYVVQLKYCDDSVLIERNDMRVNSFGYLAFDFQWCYGTAADPIIFKNNFINVYSTYYGIALDISYTSYLKVINNSFYHGGNDDDIVQFGSNYSNIEFYNNIFYSEDDGRFYSFFNPIDTANFHSDYNVFKTSGPEHFDLDGTNYPFSAWQDSMSRDQNSIYTNPLYYSDSNLHINNTFALDQTGMPIADVTNDIDGEPRVAGPLDIGADEYIIDSSQYQDLEIVGIIAPDSANCSKADSLIIQVTNNSTFSIDSFVIEWHMYGQLGNTIPYLNSIASGATITVNLGAFDFVKNTTYLFDFLTHSPNGVPDKNDANNIKQVTYYHLTDLKIIEHTDTWCSSGSELFVPLVENNGILWSTGETTQSISASPGSYSVTVTGQNGCQVTANYTVN